MQANKLQLVNSLRSQLEEALNTEITQFPSVFAGQVFSSSLAFQPSIFQRFPLQGVLRVPQEASCFPPPLKLTLLLCPASFQHLLDCAESLPRAPSCKPKVSSTLASTSTFEDNAVSFHLSLLSSGSTSPSVVVSPLPHSHWIILHKTYSILYHFP